MNDLAADSMVEQWGTGLAVRIPATVAKSARIACGQAVALEVVASGIFLRTAVGKSKLTLEQKLALFDLTLPQKTRRFKSRKSGMIFHSMEKRSCHEDKQVYRRANCVCH